MEIQEKMTHQNQAEKTQEQFIIEEFVPFSTSKLWEMQQSYYNSQSHKAWSRFGVPSYITSNPMIGKMYAEVVIAFFKDHLRETGSMEKIYIMELGTGHGRFSYHFLRHFCKLYDENPIKLPEFCYIISDFTENNLNFLQQHPKLLPFSEKGKLDFALFEAENSTQLYLRRSKITLSAQSLNQPLIVIGNYFFDVLKQDLFYIKDSSVYECLIGLKSRIDPSLCLQENPLASSKPATAATYIPTIDNISIDSMCKKINLPFFEEDYLNALLEHYLKSLSDTYLLLPTTGIRCIHKLKQLSKAGLVLLTADKAYFSHEQLDNHDFPSFAIHDKSFSLMVNFDAFNRYCESVGGYVMHPLNKNNNLAVECLLFLHNSCIYKETIATFGSISGGYEPNDHCRLMSLLSAHKENFELEEFVSIMKFCGYDTRIFLEHLSQLKNMIPSLSDDGKLWLLQILNNIWDAHYPLEEYIDVAYEIGGLLVAAMLFQEAEMYFKLSIKSHGYNLDAIQGLILCFCCNKNYEDGIKLLQELQRFTLENQP